MNDNGDSPSHFMIQSSHQVWSPAKLPNLNPVSGWAVGASAASHWSAIEGKPERKFHWAKQGSENLAMNLSRAGLCVSNARNLATRDSARLLH